MIDVAGEVTVMFRGAQSRSKVVEWFHRFIEVFAGKKRAPNIAIFKIESHTLNSRRRNKKISSCVDEWYIPVQDASPTARCDVEYSPTYSGN
jgi:hypothetical protein